MLSGGLERDQLTSVMKWIKKNLLLLVYHPKVIVSNLRLLLTIFFFFYSQKISVCENIFACNFFFSQFISSVPE